MASLGLSDLQYSTVLKTLSSLRLDACARACQIIEAQDTGIKFNLAAVLKSAAFKNSAVICQCTVTQASAMDVDKHVQRGLLADRAFSGECIFGDVAWQHMLPWLSVITVNIEPALSIFFSPIYSTVTVQYSNSNSKSCVATR